MSRFSQPQLISPPTPPPPFSSEAFNVIGEEVHCCEGLGFLPAARPACPQLLTFLSTLPSLPFLQVYFPFQRLLKSFLSNFPLNLFFFQDELFHLLSVGDPDQ
jgi:hypothetical protein